MFNEKKQKDYNKICKGMIYEDYTWTQRFLRLIRKIKDKKNNGKY